MLDFFLLIRVTWARFDLYHQDVIYLTNCDQQKSIINQEPITSLGALAFIYPLKSPQLAKSGLRQSMRQIIVSCCEQPEAAPYSIPGIKMKTYSCDISVFFKETKIPKLSLHSCQTGLLPMTCSSCLGQCCPQ